MPVPTAKGIMTKNPISVFPETSVFEAHNIIAQHNFHGVPVVDAENKLLGILTEYDLLVNGLSLHMPAFHKILAELSVSEADQNKFKEATQEIMNLKVKDIMNGDPLVILESASFGEVIKIFCEHHRVNPIPVVDKDRRVVGVISRYDVLKLFNSGPLSSDKSNKYIGEKQVDLEALSKANMDKWKQGGA